MSSAEPSRDLRRLLRALEDSLLGHTEHAKRALAVFRSTGSYREQVVHSHSLYVSPGPHVLFTQLAQANEIITGVRVAYSEADEERAVRALAGADPYPLLAKVIVGNRMLTEDLIGAEDLSGIVFDSLPGMSVQVHVANRDKATRLVLVSFLGHHLE
jgi:hypothetical protein